MAVLKTLRLWGLVGLLLLSTPPISRGDSEIVVAIRYLQAKGTSHSHLYLYREDGKLLRQLTNDNSGQDSDPIFASDGETIVFTREKPNDVREFWSIDPRGTKLKKLDCCARLVLGSEKTRQLLRVAEKRRRRHLHQLRRRKSLPRLPRHPESAQQGATPERDSAGCCG